MSDHGSRMPALTAAPDAELVTRAADGEQAAFTELFERYADRVHDHLARWSRDSALAADATREAFVTLLGSLDSLRDGAAVLPWLLGTARRRAVEELRHPPSDRPEARIARAVLAATSSDPTTSPDVAARSHETAELVWEVAAGLDEHTFTVLDLHVRQELDGLHIAAVTDTGPQDSDVDRVREHVRTLFGAALLLRLPHRDCTRLEALRTVARGTADLATARRISTHAEECVTCGPRRARAPAPLRVYGTLAPVRAPVSVRSGVMAAAAGHFGPPPPPRDLRRLLPVGLALVLLLGLVGGIASALRPTTPEPADGPPTAAAELVASPSPSPTPTPSPTATLEVLASPAPVPPPEPTVAPEPSPSPSSPSPSPTPSPTADPSPSPQALAVAIDQPQAGQRFAATAEDDQGRQAARVAVGATVAGGEGASVTWSSDRAPDDVLLGSAEGEVLLWLSEPCTDTPHVLTVTASDDTGQTATDTVEVLATHTCSPQLTVSIDDPQDGATVQRTPEDGTVTFFVAATASDDDVTWLWTTDGATTESAPEGPEGEMRVVLDDCTPTTSFTLVVEVERASDGSTAQHEITLEVDCGA